MSCKKAGNRRRGYHTHQSGKDNEVIEETCRKKLQGTAEWKLSWENDIGKLATALEKCISVTVFAETFHSTPLNIFNTVGLWF
ncbi:hypothetical protein [Salinicoccus bachuensis]|uniref:Uncharacterized protein n=1 Tax=Salinicoccus bachuensis TaxID=3136731 RepID=A0ABZ3IE09_9STAP